VARREKKPTGLNTLKVFDHVGILIDRPTGIAGLPLA
jgi:hypothetical protein